MRPIVMWALKRSSSSLEISPLPEDGAIAKLGHGVIRVGTARALVERLRLREVTRLAESRSTGPLEEGTGNKQYLGIPRKTLHRVVEMLFGSPEELGRQTQHLRPPSLHIWIEHQFLIKEPHQQKPVPLKAVPRVLVSHEVRQFPSELEIGLRFLATREDFLGAHSCFRME